MSHDTDADGDGGALCGISDDVSSANGYATAHLRIFAARLESSCSDVHVHSSTNAPLIDELSSLVTSIQALYDGVANTNKLMTMSVVNVPACNVPTSSALLLKDSSR